MSSFAGQALRRRHPFSSSSSIDCLFSLSKMPVCVCASHAPASQRDGSALAGGGQWAWAVGGAATSSEQATGHEEDARRARPSG